MVKKIVSINQLSKILNTKYPKPEQVRFGAGFILNTVLVTGCFDVLHCEHKKFLKEAKKQGDILIVGLESDKRVKKLKGKNRPVNSLEIRAENLAAFRVVDFVFPLPENFDSPKQHLKLLKLVRPNILAVSEKTPHIKEKRKLMQKIGGKLKVVLPHNPKVSTTKILHS